MKSLTSIDQLELTQLILLGLGQERLCLEKQSTQIKMFLNLVLEDLQITTFPTSEKEELCQLLKSGKMNQGKKDQEFQILPKN